MTTPHPQRCETCKKHYLYYDAHPEQTEYCPLPAGLRYDAYAVSSIIGCASHSTASNANDVLLDELIKRIKIKQSKSIIETAIGIKDLFGIIEQLRQHQKQPAQQDGEQG